VLTCYKQATCTYWGTRQSPSPSQKATRLMWKSQYVPFDGIPFINIGTSPAAFTCIDWTFIHCSNADVCHMTNQPPLSFTVKSRRLSFLDILQKWMRMQMLSKSFLSLLLRAGDIHLGGHVLPGWRPSKAVCLRWLRINLSEINVLVQHYTLIVVHATVGFVVMSHRHIDWWYSSAFIFLSFILKPVLMLLCSLVYKHF